jgi:sulfite reductase alpha subunit-like flavoprotein
LSVINDGGKLTGAAAGRNKAEPISIVNPVEARIVENEELQSAASDRSTRHLEIELANTGLTYAHTPI